MNNFIKGQIRQRPHNRIAGVMVHTSWYSTKGRSRLADACGVSRSAITRMLSGKASPSYKLVARVAQALEAELGRSLSFRELVSETGEYPTRWVCKLVGCPGCTPPAAESPDPKMRAAFKGVKAGYWTGDNQEASAPKWQPIEEVR